MVHICDVCDSEYTRADSLNRHANNKSHPQDGWRQCPTCNDWYAELGNHWSYNDDHRPSLSEHQIEVITGLLMGDGTINDQDGIQPRFKVSMVTEEFINYVNDEIFPTLGTGVREVPPGENSVQIQYECATAVHPELEQFRDWYSSGQKVFPHNIDLSPTVLKMWWVSDGHLHQYDGHQTYPVITSLNEIENKQKIESYFNDIGISIRRFTWKDIVIDHTDTQAFFSHIGSPAPGFEHKWP